jgi:hypothetical protein
MASTRGGAWVNMRDEGARMAIGIEGVGEAVTGGMLADAVEPATGEAATGAEANCLNCGAELAGAYCHQCGQKGHVHRTIHAFFHEFLHGVVHFEGKIWRTLPLLAWRPGDLTRRYVEGERARFVSPLALFLFSVFLMFATFSLVGGPFGLSDSAPNGAAQSDLNREVQQGRTRIQTLENERRAALAAGRPTARIDARLADLRQQQAGLDTAQRFVGATAAHPPAPGANTLNLDGLQADTGWPWLDHALTAAAANPSLLAYKLQTDAYKFSWVLIPLSVPFVWLMFAWRRRYKLYDHAVFVTYSIAFMTLLVVTLSLIRALLGTSALSGVAITFGPPVHMYRQLKGAYQLRWFSALWRTAALLVFALVAATLFFVLLLALGLLG